MVCITPIITVSFGNGSHECKKFLQIAFFVKNCEQYLTPQCYSFEPIKNILPRTIPSGDLHYEKLRTVTVFFITF